MQDLVPLVPTFLSYVLSFVYVGIYWNNHHHVLHACTAVTGAMLWANSAPVVLALVISVYHRVDGGKPFHRSAHRALRSGAVDGRDRVPPAPAGDHPHARADSILKQAIGRDWKGKLSPVLYILAIVATFRSSRIAQVIFVIAR